MHCSNTKTSLLAFDLSSRYSSIYNIHIEEWNFAAVAGQLRTGEPKEAIDGAQASCCLSFRLRRLL